MCVRRGVNNRTANREKPEPALRQKKCGEPTSLFYSHAGQPRGKRKEKCTDLSKKNVFVHIEKWICPKNQMYLSIFQNVFVHIAKCICLIANCICPYCKLYLSILHNVFVHIAKCICPYCKMYLSILQTVFVQAPPQPHFSIQMPDNLEEKEGKSVCICPKYKTYLSKMCSNSATT